MCFSHYFKEHFISGSPFPGSWIIRFFTSNKFLVTNRIGTKIHINVMIITGIVFV